MSTSRTRDYAIITCSGPDIPFYLPMSLNVDTETWERDAQNPAELNTELIEKIENKFWPVRSYDKFVSPKSPMELGFNYELWIPEGVDITQGSHPLLIEIYGGAGIGCQRSAPEFSKKKNRNCFHEELNIIKKVL